jgi:hypothetical protein
MFTPEQKIARVAAGMAISNLGHLGLNVKEEALTDTRYPGSWTGSAGGDVCHLAGHLMENDEHETYFTEEAEGWVGNIAGDLEKFATDFHWHPWIKTIIAM